MEKRIEEEIKYYDQKAGDLAQDPAAFAPDVIVDFEGFRPLRLQSFRYCYELLRANCKDKSVLDWGCGNGVHTVSIAQMDARRVIGIDLSEKLLEMAKAKTDAARLGAKVEFLKMDCEQTGFLDNEFDMVFDGGTFSSIDIEKALPELARILKPDGVLIGIETYGHNFLANLNRALNVKSGKRTAWAMAHIFNERGINIAKKHFGKVKVKYFHLFSWVLIPLLEKKGGNKLFQIVDSIDRVIIRIPFLRKYAFKVVFKFSNPIK